MGETAYRIIRRVTLVGLWVNMALVALKLFFGYWGHSEALVADGYHSVSDFVTDFIVIAFVGASYRKADTGHPYGHGKYETIATVMIGIILLGVGVMIGYGGAHTLVKSFEGVAIPSPDIWTLYIAVLSMLAKELTFRYTVRYAVALDSPALRANAWHHRSDAISSVATLIGVSAALFLGEQWRIMDPIACIVIAIMITFSAVRIAVPSLKDLLEQSLPEEEVRQMARNIASVPGVVKVHDLRTRRNGHSAVKNN